MVFAYASFLLEIILLSPIWYLDVYNWLECRKFCLFVSYLFSWSMIHQYSGHTFQHIYIIYRKSPKWAVINNSGILYVPFIESVNNNTMNIASLLNRQYVGRAANCANWRFFQPYVLSSNSDDVIFAFCAFSGR